MSLDDIGLSIPIYARRASGVPSTTTQLDDLAARSDSYEHTIRATFGFESMRVPVVMSLEEVLWWLNNNLMASTIVSGPDSETIWEGFLTQIDATFGQETVSVGLDRMANRVRCRYTGGNGTPTTTSTSSDSASQRLYGTKDALLNLNTTSSTAAANIVAAYLARWKNPPAVQRSRVATGDAGGVSVAFTFAGWYAVLGWLLYSNTSTVSSATTAIANALISSYVGVNNFLSTDTTQVTASGINDLETVPDDTPYIQKLEDCLKQGNSANQRLAWGIYEGRRLTVKQWAGATPDTIAYERSLQTGEVRRLGGTPVSPWLVRPDAMYQTIELLDVGPVTTAPDTAARKYCERVRCTIQGDAIGVDLDPQEADSVEAQLARLK